MRPRSRALLRPLRAALAALGALVLIVTFSPLVVWWGGVLAGRWDDVRGDVLIVPGASSLPDGVLGESSCWRAVHAARFWRAGGYRRIIVTGAQAAIPIRDFLVG